MSSRCFVVVASSAWLSLGAVAGTAQTDHPVAAYVAWAEEVAKPLVIHGGNVDAYDLRPLGSLVGSARVISISEPFHGAHEPLRIRNLAIEYLVLEHGLTAVALETGLAKSKLLYDYVLGSDGDATRVAEEAFGYRFGLFQENVDLIQWLRDHNRNAPPSGRVRLYGVDLTGQEFPLAYQALETLIGFLSRTDLAGIDATAEALQRLVPIFRGDRYGDLTTEEKRDITVTIERSIAYLDRERQEFLELVGWDDYDWARRQAVNARQDNAFLMSEGEGPGPIREAAIADNLRWVLEREGPGGRVLFFANNSHTGSHHFSPGNDVPDSWSAAGIPSAGYLLRSVLGPDLVTIGTYFGTGVGDFWYLGDRPALSPDPGDIGALLGSYPLPAYLVNLRDLPTQGPLRSWMLEEHGSRAARFRLSMAPASAFDALIYIDRVTPAVRAQPRR